ncbi:8992_t:CDS:1, partial [Diversispora eburnea]
TFDYPSFTHKFRIDNLAYFISEYFDSSQGNSYNNNVEIVITTESGILFTEICKLLINRCSFLNYFEMTEIPENYSNDLNYNDLIGSIIKLPGASKVFNKLETFVSATTNDELTRPLYESLALFCNNILNIDLIFKSESQVQLLEKLISVQKRLENLSIIGNSNINCNSLLWVLVSKKETLESLRLKSVDFYHFEEKSSPIGQFTSLKKLYIEYCLLYKSDSLFFASLFTQLSSFHYIYSIFSLNVYSQEFIIKILETANTNLKNICLDLFLTIPSDTFSTILNYCTKITELNLLNLSLEQIITIFNNNFKELRRFHL